MFDSMGAKQSKCIVGLLNTVSVPSGSEQLECITVVQCQLRRCQHTLVFAFCRWQPTVLGLYVACVGVEVNAYLETVYACACGVFRRAGHCNQLMAAAISGDHMTWLKHTCSLHSV